MPGRLSRRLSLLLSCALSLCSFAARPARAQIAEGQLKGLVIERITRFIDWPADAIAVGASFGICIAGTGQVPNDVARVARTLRFKDRPPYVRRLATAADPSSCQVLFIAGTESGRLADILAAVGDNPTLVVSDTPGFAQRGVLVNLYLEGEYVRFEINLAQVSKSPLRFSSKLLRLARLVNLPLTAPK